MDRVRKVLAEEAPVAVHLRRAVDVSSPPGQVRASFPYPDLTPPWTLLSQESALPACLFQEGSALCSAPSQSLNLGPSEQQPCRVTCRTLCLSNSHAGTHADQPAHFHGDPDPAEFLDGQYSGEAVVLDVSGVLPGEGCLRAVTRAMLEETAREADVDLTLVTRLLLKTYRGEIPQEWDKEFAHLEPSAASFLASLPRLVLLGLDTPSVDHPTASPLIEHSHGRLWDARIAILENLDLSGLAFGDTPRLAGTVDTVWVPERCFEDAKGAVVRFFPQEQRQ